MLLRRYRTFLWDTERREREEDGLDADEKIRELERQLKVRNSTVSSACSGHSGRQREAGSDQPVATHLLVRWCESEPFATAAVGDEKDSVCGLLQGGGGSGTPRDATTPRQSDRHQLEKTREMVSRWCMCAWVALYPCLCACVCVYPCQSDSVCVYISLVGCVDW